MNVPCAPQRLRPVLWAFYAAACLAVMTSPSRGGELTADEILQRSKEAMAPPIRYRMINNGMSTILSQKTLPDGVTATRIESSSPSRIALLRGRESYEFHPEQGVGIDMSLMQQSALTRAANIAEALGEKASAVNRVSTALIGGRECYEITKSFSPDALAAMSKSLPDSAKKQIWAKLPREEQTLIDKQTFVRIATRTVSQSGSTISESEYRDIEHSVDLPDDLFLPPDGIELLKPRSLEEYVGMITQMLQPRRELVPMRPAITLRKPMLPPPRSRRPQIDPRTGRIISPLRPGENRNEADRLLPRGIGAKPTAAELLRRSMEAMKPPVRYTVTCGGVTTTVCQKVLADGSAGTRLESISPVHKVSISLDKTIVELYPDLGVGIDMAFPRRAVSIQAAAIPSGIDEEGLSGAEIKAFSLESGRECLDIVTAYPPHLAAAITSNLPPPQKRNAPAIVPHEVHTIIDAKTHETAETRLISANGSTIACFEYKNVEHPTDLSDDLFSVPDGIELLQPRENTEYAAHLRNDLKLRPGDLAASQDARLEIDPQTRRTVLPLALGQGREEFERRVASRLRSSRAARREPPDARFTSATVARAASEGTTTEDAAAADDFSSLVEDGASSSGPMSLVGWGVAPLLVFLMGIALIFVRRRRLVKLAPARTSHKPRRVRQKFVASGKH
jgi:hypothetical protein